MIVIAHEQRAEILESFSRAAKFVEEHYPRMSKLVGYIYLCEKPPKGWRVMKAKRPSTGGYSIIGPDKKARHIWVRTFKRLDCPEYYVGVIVHELAHLFQARNLSHIQFYGRYYRSKKSRLRYEDNADQAGNTARKLYEHLTYPTRK